MSALRHGHTAHGSVSPTYRSWLAMRQRCANPNHISYPRYGGRGITVCERWSSSFDAFLEDMGVRPPGTSLDRVDNNGIYEPGNCKWSDLSEQASNRRTILSTGWCRKGHDISFGGAYVYEKGGKRFTICKQCRREDYLRRKATTALAALGGGS